jgi:outer membrane receptor protein involved in Fe transport
LQGLKIAAWVTFSDAQLTQPLPPGLEGTAVAPAGAALPYSTRFSGNLSVDQEFPIANLTRGLVGGSVSYIGHRLDTFEPTGVARQALPGYAKIDLHAGVKYESWTANLFVSNLTNRTAFSAWGGPATPNVFYIIQPRTVGLSVARTF